MIKKFYEDLILKYPLKTLLLLSCAILFLGFYATKLEVDASSDTILLENDSDLLYSQEITKKFKTQDILFIAFTPKEPLLSISTQSAIATLSKELQKLDKVSSITSILNVPLLESSKKELKELINNIPTLEKKNADFSLAKKEFLTSPIYKNNLVSEDFKSTAIIVNLKSEEKIAKDNVNYKKLRDERRAINHQFILDIREIIKNHKDDGEFFLGGVNMISDDLISFVKNDLYIFGSTLIGLLIFLLWIIFREIRWVILPIIICISSIVATSGLLGFFHWEVTVISSNFISLQLIITLSIVLHLIVRYKELLHVKPNYSQKELILETILSKISPSFFAILTTIVGFSSLVFSSILPVINLGWMMSSGIAISLILAFIIFPAILILLPISRVREKKNYSFSPTKFMATLVENYGKSILFVSSFLVLFSLSGASQLIVENSFINYFRPSTEIYKGMKIIDEKLGGTTPLDVIVKFNDTQESNTPNNNENVSFADESAFASFENEFEEESNDNQYWFSPEKMALAIKVHDYLSNKPEIGNVQSLGTILKLGKTLNDGKTLDNFQLALLYNKLPKNFKQIILEPYLNIEENTLRFSTRIIDSNKNLRRDVLIKQINNDLEKIIDPEIATFRQSNLMILYNNMLQSLFESQIMTLGFVLVLLFAMFLLIFRSLSIALIAITTNAISIGVIFGFMGWLHIPLDLMTITIAAISLGIGVDDTIHYIHRFREELEKDNNLIEAMKRSHNSIGYAMYYTTFAIMLGFSILVLSNFTPTIYFGFLTMTAMLSALLGAMLLLPKLLIIFGKNIIKR